MNTSDIPAELEKQVRLEALGDTYAKRAEGPGTKAEKLRAAFIETIELGLWRPDDPVPTEKELLAVLPISQGTVQAAMRRLADDGIVVRKRGAGSRISSSGARGQDPWYMRFLAEDGADLASTAITRVTTTEVRGRGDWSTALGIRPSYVKIERTLNVGDSFLILAIAYLDAGRFRPLLDFSSEIMAYTHIRHLLHDRFNVPTMGVRQSARLRGAAEDVAQVTGVDAGTPVLVMQTVNLTLHQEPVIYQEFHIPPNDFILDLAHRPGHD